MPAPSSSVSTRALEEATGGSGYLAAKIGGSSRHVLVDTGATRSVIPKQIWLSITKGGSDLQKYVGDARAANGGAMEVLGGWQTVCQFDSLALVADFLVSDVPSEEILLGFDFLSRYGAVVDLGEKTCRIMGKTFPLVDLNPTSQPQTVVVQNDTVVPPRSEAIISGMVQSAWGDYAEGMLEPTSALSKHCDLLVARVVCKVEKGTLPVRVINVTSDALPLKKGMKVGTLFTDIEVDEVGGCTGEGGDALQSWTVDSLMSQFGVGDKGLSVEQTEAVKQLLHRNLSVFSRGETDLGRTHLTMHEIDTGEAKPIKLPPRRVPLHLQQEVADGLKQMLDSGIIRPSCSPWAAPVVLVRKKGGGLRFCVDYRKLNDVTSKDAYPLPRIDDALDSLSHACWFSTLDLASGYWQVEVDPKDRYKTAFITRQGLFEFNVLSFGLCNAPSTFQRLMDLILADLQWTTCLVYLDDIIVFGRTFQEHLARLDEVLVKLQQANLKIKPSKCNLFSTQVHYLGHVISAEGVMADPAKVAAVREWPVPRNQTEVQSFVGLASYYRRFVKGFADIARPLHQLAKKGKRFQWTEDCQRAFDQLKASLITAPVLAYPDPNKTFILDTDASDVGIGAVLSQEWGGHERVVAYASRALTKQERKYATTKKELLSMVMFTKHFKHYLLGKEFVLRTDHNSLRWLHNFQGLEGQLARWVEQLANFQYKIVHRPGKLHANADALSRLPAFGDGGGQGQELPASKETSKEISKVCAVQEIPHGPPREAREIDELAQAQMDDRELRQIIDCKKQADECHMPDDPELHKYAPVWSQLHVQGSRLVRIPPAHSDAASQTQVVLPCSLIPKVLAQLHNDATGGHLGVHKLQGKVKDRFYWPGWFGDVKRWVKECVDCSSRKTQGKLPCAPLQPSVTSRPFERVALDILGPLPETPCKNKYILVIGDYFSKWTEAFPLPNQEASTIAKVLTEEWVCRFGVPRSIHSDQGRNFESTLFREVCRLLHIHKSRTSPYHAQSDGLIERFNRTLLSMLSLFVEDNQLNWDTLLPYVMLAYRSSVHASTAFTPYKVLFGQEIVLPIDIMLNLDTQEHFSSVNDYVSRMRETLSTVVEAVRRHQSRASEKQKNSYDFRANFQYYSEGELVWVQNKARKRGLCPKLQRRYKGPFRVVERVTDVLYRLMSVEGGPECVVHFNRLKPYNSSLAVTSDPVSRRAEGLDRPDIQLTRPRRQRSEVRFGAGWVHHRRPADLGTSEGERLPLRDHAAQGSVSSGAGGTQRIPLKNCSDSPASVGPSPEDAPAACSSQEERPESNGQGSSGGRPLRHRRPPVWSQDYQMIVQ